MPSSAASSIAPASSRTKCSGEDPAGARGRNRSTARYWYKVVIRAVAARVVPNASWVIWPVVRTRCSQIMRSSHRSRAVSRAASAAARAGLRASLPAARGRPGRAKDEGMRCPPRGSGAVRRAGAAGGRLRRPGGGGGALAVPPWAARAARRISRARPGTGGGSGRVLNVKAGVSALPATSRAAAW